jgi:uncharacterized protein YbaP (TraB family)
MNTSPAHGKGTLLNAKAAVSFLLLVVLALTVIIVNAQEHGASLLWRISGNGLVQPSYLYGTLHSKDARVFEFHDSVMAVFDSSKAFAMEIEMESGLYTNIFTLMVEDKNYDLKTYLSTAEYDQLERYLKREYGLKLEYFEKIKPVFLYLVMTNTGVSTDNHPYLDEYLYKMAMDKGKKVYGLQKLEQQIESLDSLPLAGQAELLKTALKAQTIADKEKEKLLETYKKGDLAKVQKIQRKADYPDKLYRLLIEKHNQQMANRIDSIVRKQSTFIALGACHLPGEAGIFELLEKKGYKIEAVQ